MSLRNWIGRLKPLHHARWQWDSVRSASALLPNVALPSDELSNSTAHFASPGALTHAASAKVKFLGVYIGFVDDAKRKRQYDKALEKRRRVIHRLRQLQKQRQESWEKEVQRLAFNAFTRAYRKTLNTLRSGSKAKQAIFDKASELGTKAALTLTDNQPLMTTDDLKKLLAQEEDHFGRLGWEYLPVLVKAAYKNLMLSIEQSCEDLQAQIAASRRLTLSSNKTHSIPAIACNNFSRSDDERAESGSIDSNHTFENVMERVVDPETLSAAYARIQSKLQVLSGKTSDDWHDLHRRFFDDLAHQLRTKTYQFSPVSHIHVRKPGKDEARRAIVVVSPRDQVVAEAVRAELESMYGPMLGKLAGSCHMALEVVKKTWRGTTWFLHYKSPIAFGKSHQENLVHVLSARVKDPEFLSLIQQMFEARVVNLGDRGSPLSALLCSIYYHQLDMEVARIQAEMNTGSNKRKGRQLGEEAEALAEPFARVRYVRHAEEFLFGVTGSKAMALEVSERIQTFLRRELKLREP